MTPADDLLNFVSAVSGDTFLKVEENLGDGYVRLKISEAERRQAKHDIRSTEDIVVELLRNSRDAHAQRIFLASGREGDIRTLTIIDDGVGVPKQLQDRVFEPRVTSKLDTMVMDRWGVHGRGMALYSIRENVSEARIVTSDAHKGAAITVVADAVKLTERADQSTWPKVERDEEGIAHVARGPHNVIRRVVEFALEHPGMDVYIGSATEVLSTLVMLARFELDESDLMFCDDEARLPVWQRPGAAAGAAELAQTAESIGLPVSERTAHRILSGEIVPLRPALAVALKLKQASSDEPSVDIYRDRRGLKIHEDDLKRFKGELEAAFDSIAERYYLQLRCEPKVTVGREDIRVRFEIDKED